MARGGPRGWPGRITDRLRFERGARAAFPSVRGSPTGRAPGGGFCYTATIPVPFYEPRQITVIFPPGQRVPTVLSDGPTDSPHRYEDGGLCMWHPSDPASKRWSFDDGLLDLLDTIKAHLFREAWWREHHQWLGPEIIHGPDLDGSSDAT